MRVAVVDVGSNSIKLLVADRGAAGRLTEVRSRTLEVRIGGGIGSERPRLRDEARANGVAAIRELLAEADTLGAETATLVATSAVRDAENGGVFQDEVRAAVGRDLRVLTGAEEANLIGRGLATDPTLAGLRDFAVFDLGGGSLECLAFQDRSAVAIDSLPLGCVRLTERWIAQPAAPIDEAARLAVAADVRQTMLDSRFPLPLPEGAPVVGTGGTLTTVRAMDAAARGVPVADASPRITVAALRGILEQVAALPIERRAALPGLPKSRADVFPAALVALVTVAEVGQFDVFRHSFRNLRWGIAADGGL